MLHVAVLAQLLLALHLNNLFVPHFLFLQARGFFQLLHLKHLVLGHDVHAGLVSHRSVPLCLDFLLHFSLSPQLLFAVSVFVVPVSYLDHLFSLFLGFFNFFPGFLFFELQEGDAIGEQPCVVGGFLLILASSHEGPRDFTLAIVVLLVVLVLRLVVAFLVVEGVRIRERNWHGRFGHLEVVVILLGMSHVSTYHFDC